MCSVQEQVHQHAANTLCAPLQTVRTSRSVLHYSSDATWDVLGSTLEAWLMHTESIFITGIDNRHLINQVPIHQAACHTAFMCNVKQALWHCQHSNTLSEELSNLITPLLIFTDYPKWFLLLATELKSLEAKTFRRKGMQVIEYFTGICRRQPSQSSCIRVGFRIKYVSSISAVHDAVSTTA